jgi:hypothetical protein
MSAMFRILPIAHGTVIVVAVAICGYVVAHNNGLDSRLLFPIVIMMFLFSSGSSWSHSTQPEFRRCYQLLIAGFRNRRTRRIQNDDPATDQNSLRLIRLPGVKRRR